MQARPTPAGGAPELAAALDAAAVATGFSGAVRVDAGGEPLLARAWGDADRAQGIPNTVETQFAVASGAKGLTALAVASLVEDGALSLATTARSLLGGDLPLVDDRVTVEHLLAHRSGIGDYLDESAAVDVEDYVLPVPAAALATTEDYLAVLDGPRQAFAPGARFAYCNSGFVLLALLAERASGVAFLDLVAERVCAPAGMPATAFLRSDQLPRSAALGYLRDGRTNVGLLPVRGSGDGGVYTTLEDVASLWHALFAGRIVSTERVRDLLRPRSERYGLGFWLDGGRVRLEGRDAGVSFRSVHDPADGTTHTVVSNTTDGAWPLARLLAESL